MLLENLLFFVTSMIILVISGYYLVKSLSKIASFLKISEFVLGFILLAVSTSLPELFIGIKSALLQTPSLTLGNVIGANILNLTIVIGFPIIIARGIKVRTEASRKDAVYMFLIVILPIVLFIMGNGLSKLDGVILLTVFILYARILLIERKVYVKQVNDKLPRKQAIIYTVVFMLSLAMLFKAAEFVVKYAKLISIEIGVPDFLIGIFIVSLGTTLPELTVGTIAVLTKHYELMLGDALGSVIVNSTLVLGVTSFIYPIRTSLTPVLASGVFMIIIAYIVSVLLREKNELDWKYGTGLIFIYLIFVVYQLYFEFRIV